MIRFLTALLLIGLIAVNGLIYLKMNALEASVAQLQARSSDRMICPLHVKFRCSQCLLSRATA